MDKPSAFVDSSVFIAALLSSSGGSFYILNNLADKVNFKTNNYVLGEIDDVLDRKFAGQDNLYSTLFLLLSVAKVTVLPSPPKHLLAKLTKIISEKDTPILANALKNSDILLTLDNEFFGEKITELANKRSLKIFKPKDLIEFLKQG